MLADAEHLFADAEVYVQAMTPIDPAPIPLLRHGASSSRSDRKRSLQVRQSISGSLNPATWPEASHTAGLRITAESMATMSSRSCTIARTQSERMWFFISTP